MLSLPLSKVKDWHLQRKAVVYIRQSTPQQVLEHRESADRQYSLVYRAELLGWSADRVEVVDEDQGHSGQSAVGRLGFQYLLAEISLDHVGLIPGLTHHFSQGFRGFELIHSTSTRFSTPPRGGDGECFFLCYFSQL